MYYIKTLKASMKLVGKKMAAGVGVRQVRYVDELRTRSLIPSHCPPEYDRGALFLEKRAAPRRASVLRHAVRNADKVDRKLSPSSLSIVGSIR